MNFHFYPEKNTANDAKSVTKHSGGTKICTGCSVMAASNSTFACKNCAMVFVKIIKVKSIVDLRGKATKCCTGCGERAKSNRALKCKLCKTPFVIKASGKKSKRKASTTFVKKAKKAKTESAFTLIVEDDTLSVPIALSRGSSLQTNWSLDTSFVEPVALYSGSSLDTSFIEPVALSRGSSLDTSFICDVTFDLSGPTTYDDFIFDDASIDEMTSAFTEECDPVSIFKI